MAMITREINQLIQAAEQINQLIQAAEQGDARAQCNIGRCYNYGSGVEQDYEQAIYWYRKAAEQGDAEAQCQLGRCYDNGWGVKQDYEQAVYWYHKAIEQGDTAAQYWLGCCYAEGEGVEQDNKQAYYWFRKAAEQGNEWSMFTLGCYYKNRGNEQQAIYWWNKANEAGLYWDYVKTNRRNTTRKVAESRAAVAKPMGASRPKEYRFSAKKRIYSAQERRFFAVGFSIVFSVILGIYFMARGTALIDNIEEFVFFCIFGAVVGLFCGFISMIFASEDDQ